MEDPRKQLQDDLDRIGEQRRTAEAAWKAAVEATDPAIERGLRGGLGPAEISRRVGITDSYVRKIRKLKGLPSDPRYASNRPPVRVPETDARDVKPAREAEPWAESVASPARERKPKLSPRVAHLDPTQAVRIAARAESRADGGWAARVIAEYPGLSANWHPYVVVEAGLHRGFIEDTDLPA